MKYIFFDPKIYDLLLLLSQYLWSKESYKLHSRHSFAIPPADYWNALLPSKDIIISCLSFCNFFIAIMTSFIAAWCGCWLYCLDFITNHWCLMTVECSTISMLLLQGLYVVKIVIRLLCRPKIDKKVHCPISYLTWAFWRIADEILLSANIAVTPG